MSVRNESEHRRKRWLVQLEILALILVSLSQIFMCVLALILTVPVAHVGGWLDAPATPGEQYVLTTEGFLRFSSRFSVPALGLAAIAVGIHRWLVRPLARRLST